MPKIIAASIRFYSEDGKYPQIICGERHCDCYEWMFNHQVKCDKNTIEEGFLTHQYQFVDRYEAKLMAYDWGQIDKDVYEENSPLYSEDLW